MQQCPIVAHIKQQRSRTKTNSGLESAILSLTKPSMNIYWHTLAPVWYFNFMMHTTTELANLLNKSPETIRRWVEEFKAHLSPIANPATGQRRFTDDDVRVLTLVYALKEQGKIYDEIHIALQNGERGELLTNASKSQGIQITTANHELATLQEEIMDLKYEVERLKRYEAQHELLNKMLTDAYTKIDLLNQQIGRLTPKT